MEIINHHLVMKLSVVINTKNAAETLDACLDSVGFADEIVVVDMHSFDKTKEIALKHKARFYFHDDVGYVEPARNYAIKQATHPLILVLDADERVSAGLQKQIVKILKLDDPADVYLFPRKNIMFGQWIKHTGWWPDYQPRLFQKDKVQWSETIHQPPMMKGRVVKLPVKEDYAILHQHYPNLHVYLERLNRYTSIQAENSLRGFSQPVEATTVISTFFNEFFRRFFVFSGYKDSTAGVGLSFLQACYELSVQLKVWEQDKNSCQSIDEKDTIRALEKSRSDLSYWLADWKVKNTMGIYKIFWKIRRRLKI